MAELLPAIDIAVAISPTEFLSRASNLYNLRAKFKIERESLGGIDVVNFRLQEPHSHKDIGFQLIADESVNGRVSIEIRAEHWSPDPPTKAVYVAAARELVGNVLSSYNRLYGTRHRLRISKQSVARFKMTEQTKRLVERFTICANTHVLHFKDWQRFYALVKAGRQEIPDYVFRPILVNAGFAPRQVDKLAETYVHLWAYKRLQ